MTASAPASDPPPIMAMNPDGLSAQAERRAAARAAGAGVDPEPPDYNDIEAFADYRRALHAAWGEGIVAGETPHESITIAGRDALVAGPVDAPTVLYLHSGGFCLGSPSVEAPITARLATRLRIVSLDYRLAPEHLFPAAIDDAERAYRELADRHGRVAVAGCSAGGNLAVAVARRCVDRPVAALALFCPHLDFGLVRQRPLRGFEAAYLAGHDIADPEVSPAGATAAQLGPLPPISVQWSVDEPMAPEITAFVHTVAGSGTPIRAQAWRGLWHAWHFHRELPEAWQAVDDAAEWLAVC